MWGFYIGWVVFGGSKSKCKDTEPHDDFQVRKKKKTNEKDYNIKSFALFIDPCVLKVPMGGITLNQVDRTRY